MSIEPARSHFVVRDDIRLHHLDWGNHGRHPLLLVHGSRLHAHVWNDFSRRFNDRLHIVAVDQRGHGDSGWCARQCYELEDFYRDLRAVVQARGLGRFTLVGHSLGGRVCMLYASRHPEELERLVLVDITPGRASAGRGADISRIAETPPPRDFDTHEEAIEYLGRLLSRAPAHLVEESVRRGMRRIDGGRYTWKYDPALLQRRRSATDADALWESVRSIEVPTLLQYGALSQVVTAELAARLAATMPRCSVERIEGAGHALFTDQPEAFARSVAGFLAVG
ncbi:MAG: alpha/beta hydrolase [Burkholderiales bacterium]|nr:alpha/beta hydrolase [Burkholderiales bacterium]